MRQETTVISYFFSDGQQQSNRLLAFTHEDCYGCYRQRGFEDRKRPIRRPQIHFEVISPCRKAVGLDGRNFSHHFPRRGFLFLLILQFSVRHNNLLPFFFVVLSVIDGFQTPTLILTRTKKNLFARWLISKPSSLRNIDNVETEIDRPACHFKISKSIIH